MTDINILLACPYNSASETFLTKENLDLLRSIGTIHRPIGANPFNEDELTHTIRDMDVIVTTWGQIPFTKKVLSNANRLKFIAHTAGTVAPFYTKDAIDRGIRVSSGNDVFAESVAEAVLAYMFSSLRDIPHHDRQLKAGHWRGELDNRGLFGKTIGLVGFGTIPRFLTNFIKPFRCNVLAYDPFCQDQDFMDHGAKRETLETIFKTSDIVSIHLPLKEDTFGLIDYDLLQSMKSGSILINTARGQVIKEVDLIKILEEGHIKAVLDVFEIEPLPIDSPLRKLDNAILIPHMAGPTLDRREDAARIVIEDIKRFLNNETLLHEIKPEKAAHMTR